MSQVSGNLCNFLFQLIHFNPFRIAINYIRYLQATLEAPPAEIDYHQGFYSIMPVKTPKNYYKHLH